MGIAAAPNCSEPPMAQTRCIGKHNEKAYLLSAPRSSALPQWADHAERALRPLTLFPCRLLKLTLLGRRRTAPEDRKASFNNDERKPLRDEGTRSSWRKGWTNL